MCSKRSIPCHKEACFGDGAVVPRHAPSVLAMPDAFLNPGPEEILIAVEVDATTRHRYAGRYKVKITLTDEECTHGHVSLGQGSNEHAVSQVSGVQSLMHFPPLPWSGCEMCELKNDRGRGVCVLCKYQ